MREKTEVLYGVENTTRLQLQVSSNAKSVIFVCGDSISPSVILEIKSNKKLLLDCIKKGVKYKIITEINGANILYCKDILNLIGHDSLRHLDKVKGNFAVTESEYIATSNLQDSQPLQQIIYSNVKEVIEQHKYLFETLWEKSIPALQKIREIEEGLQPDVIEIIRDSGRAKELYQSLVKCAKKEVMIIFPTINAFMRQEKIGIIELLRKAVDERNVKVRILMPLENLSEINKMHIVEDQYNQIHQIIHNRKTIISNIDTSNIFIRHIERMSETKATILIVDKNYSLVMELKDDLKNDFDQAVGLSTYSSSLSGVLSYVAIFESLWIETDLYEQLKIHDRMQKEFINIAAHELRTPTQAILGFSGLLKKHPEKTNDLVDGVFRNAIRLQRLISNILDVTAIESQSFRFSAERFNLNDLISSIIDDYKNQIKKTDNVLELNYIDKNSTNINPILIECDKERIIQVISNLLDNAIKFTKRGVISITSEVEEKYKDDKKVIISVKDSGSGIDNEIFPKLFSKFATKSFQGTGLGLFICKNIIENYGGKIWAENNTDGKGGTTIIFSLPLMANYGINDKESKGDRKI
jgi:two-component system, OmpR family, sensor histidine kinase VicK